jgi:hypothetical protein
MGRFARVVMAASRRSLYWLLRRSASRYRMHPARPSQDRPPVMLYDRLDTVFGDQRQVMTPAQAAAFATRSFTWRCVSCGKVHAFDRPVRVGAASPCSCLQIEFETDVKRRPGVGYAAFRGMPEG